MLDSNVYTLNLVPRETDPDEVYLIDQDGENVYMRKKTVGVSASLS